MNGQQLNSTVKWFIGDHYGSKSVIKSHLERCTVYSNFLKTFCLLIYAIKISKTKITHNYILEVQNSKI